MAYEYDKGVYEPDEELSKHIIDSENADEKADMPDMEDSLDPFSEP